MASREDFSALWERIDAALTRYAALVRGSLRPPPSAEDIAWIEQFDTGEVGIAGAYRAHDGARHGGGIFALLPVTAAALSWTRLTFWLTARAAREELERLEARRSATEARRFPIARLYPYRPDTGYEDGEETHQCLAVDTNSGELLALSYKGIAPAQVSPLGFTWVSYLHDLAQQLAAGGLEAYREDPPARVLYLHPRRVVAPIDSPRSDAEVLVQLLGERSLLSLHGPPSPQLLARVGQALRKRTEKARLAALRATFETLEEVDEDYARDDDLAALVTLVLGR